MSRRSRHRMFPITDIPEVGDLIVYYATRVLHVPIFVDTDLQWFRTPRFVEWVMECNLQGGFLDIMKGSLKDTYGCRIPQGMQIELPHAEVEKIERWLESWKNDTFPRRYTMSRKCFPDLMGN